MSDYRWERASGGEVPAGAPEAGHGWEWRDTDDGQEREPLWLVRSLPAPDGSVLLGQLRRGEARVGPEYHESPVEEYEVLLDAGEWRFAEPDENDNVDLAAAGGVACGRAADGSPIYATLRDREGEGEEPGGNPARVGFDFARNVLVAPAGVASGEASVPAESQGAATEPEPVAATGPVAVVSRLDLKQEVVEIANTGDGPLDLGGWKLRDESTGKPYVFPNGTVVAAGATVRVRSGPGAASPGEGELAWKTTSVWNDRGDTAFLEDPSGELVSSRKG